MEEIVDLNVIITPSEKVVNQVIEWSNLIACKYKTNYILNKNNYLPHLSLYSARYPQENYKSLTTAVKKTADSFSPFTITLSVFSVFSGYIFFDADKNDKLQQLHENIVDSLNPLRNGHITDNQKTLTGLTDMQKTAIETYGYVSVKERYMPYISLTSLVNLNESKDVISLLPKETMSFTVTELAVSPFAEYGTCPKISERYVLG